MQPVNDNIYVLIVISLLGGMLLAGGVLYVVVSYVRKIRRQKEELQQVELAYRSRLFTAVIESQEEERRKIGREMHDEVGSTLSAIRLGLSSRIMLEGEDERTLETIRSVDKLSTIVRNISHLLSPPELEYAGFHDALESLCDSFSHTGQVEITIRDDAFGTIPLAKFNTALSLYRIFQELLTNTLKHAGATQINIHLYNEGTTFIAVYEDNGRGFDTEDSDSGLGMQNIRSRLLMIQATCKLESAPGKGFKCTVYLGHQHIGND
jgi:signal transduction histidine kinase